MAANWYVVYPAGESQSGSQVPAGSRVVSAVAGSAADSAWHGNGSYGGWQVLFGPYATQAEAQDGLDTKAAGPGPIQGFATGVGLGLGNESQNAALSNGQSVQNAADKLTGWTHNIEQWVIRGFEMLLGIGLIVIALAKLASDTPAGKMAIKAGKAAAIL